ncbi:hypothetical protein FXF75_06695 [Halorussus sp. MSC15.2]|nr:hypothetical protein [Halorussus sp. MSC15.2]
MVALGAIGLALVYNIAEVPNFAHGELLMLGAYMALFVNKPATVPVFELLTQVDAPANSPRSDSPSCSFSRPGRRSRPCTYSAERPR